MNTLEKTLEQFLQLLHKEKYINIKDPNFIGTPDRMTKMYRELLDGSIDTDKKIKSLFNKTFPSKYKGLVVATDILVWGICPHHFLPVKYIIDLGYIPGKDVIGVSKMNRICKVLAARAVLQEDLTQDIIDSIKTYIEPEGAMVIVKGVHGCMTSRGIKQENPIITSQILGEFEDSKVRQEFLSLIER